MNNNNIKAILTLSWNGLFYKCCLIIRLLRLYQLLISFTHVNYRHVSYINVHYAYINHLLIVPILIICWSVVNRPIIKLIKIYKLGKIMWIELCFVLKMLIKSFKKLKVLDFWLFFKINVLNYRNFVCINYLRIISQ